MASRYRRMRGSISYKQPSTKRGEAQQSLIGTDAAHADDSEATCDTASRCSAVGCG